MTWHELYTEAIQAFNDTPGAQLEQHLIDAYAEHPAAVAVAISKITQAHKAGKINSPWGAVKAEVSKQIAVRANIPAAGNRATQERNAEQWIRSAGLHYDRWAELHDELFGDRGPLRPWADDQVLEARVRRVYDEVRPVGEQIEQRELEEAAKWLATRSAILSLAKHQPKQPVKETTEAA